MMFDPQDYTGVRRPLDQAETLPSSSYTSEEFFNREVARIFSSAWQFAGRVDELSEPGQTLVVNTITGSFLVVRDHAGRIRGFRNTCRHRGAQLMTDSAVCRNFICPYHSWTYGLDGALRGAPGMDGVQNFDKTMYGLERIRLEIWGGFVFINQDDNAPDLMTWLGDLPAQMAGHQPDAMRCVRRKSFDINANWKFLIENALEAYHTGTVHRETLGVQDSSAVEVVGNWDALYVPSDVGKTLATLPGTDTGFPFLPELTGLAATGTYFTVIYPCTQIVFAQDCIWWLDFKPIAVDQTRLTIGSCFPESTIALSDFKQRVAPYYERWDNATPEDNAIAEAQHAGHRTGLSRPGRFALTEHCVHRLDNWVLNQIL